jgi:recombination protein RecA
MIDAETLRREINKAVGKETVLRGSDEKFTTKYLSTNVLPFDIALGGGIPRGRYVELTGDYSTLKSYLSLMAIANVQQSGGMAALIDTEHAYDEAWAQYLGVDTDKLMLVHPETGEEAVDVIEMMLRNQVDFVCLDSIAATLPQQEAGKKLTKESVQPARLAALLSLAYRKLTAANSRTAILLINQLREQVGITFGPTEKAPGGRATGFYASLRVNCRKAGKVTRDIELNGFDKMIKSKEQIGQTYRMTVEKSKLSRPWREVYFDWDLEHNEISIAKFLMLQGMDLGLVERTGNTWSVDGSKSAVGSKETFLKHLREDAEAQDFLESKIRAHHGLEIPADLSARLGRQTPRNKPVTSVSAKSSASSGRVSTRGVGRGVSRSTAAPTKRLSK